MAPDDASPELRWPATLDHAALFAALCAPQGAAHERARAALDGVTDPREAIEIAAAKGLCPLDWIESDARAFGGAAHSPRRAPYTVDAARALLSDAPGVLRAEALAREFIVRASRFTGALPPPASAIYWKPRTPAQLARGASREHGPRLPPALLRTTFRAMNTGAILRAIHSVCGEAPRASPAPRPLFVRLLALLGADAREPAPRQSPYAHPVFAQWERAARAARTIVAAQALDDHRCAWEYAAAARAGLSLQTAIDASLFDELEPEVVAAPLASLPNPFVPLAALWRTGYALHAVERDKLTLVLPLPA